MISEAISITIHIIFWFITFWPRKLVKLYETVTKKERDVSNDIVLITGTGHGIGKELALQYSALGATIVCWDINEQSNMGTVKQIKSKGGKAHGYTVDITNREKVLESGIKVLRQIGAITILVANTEIMPQHELPEHTEGEIRKAFEINTNAYFWMHQIFLPTMIDMNSGHVVAHSSIAGLVGCVQSYKSKLRSMMQSVAEDLRMYSYGNPKIKFTAVYPNMTIRQKDFAATIISAQRQGITELNVPRCLTKCH